jgi:cell wall-associated NlpC family hydrolase
MRVIPRELYADLLGRPYAVAGGDPATGLCCSGVALEVLRRMGRELPEDALPLAPSAAPAALSSAAATGSCWERIGSTRAAARIPGDIVLLDLPSGEHHVAVAVGNGVFLSSDERRGVHALRLRAIVGKVLGAYRLRRQP